MNKEQTKQWIEENLLVKSEILEKYHINSSYFDVSVSRFKLKPFVRKGNYNMYLKEDVEQFLKKNEKTTLNIKR